MQQQLIGVCVCVCMCESSYDAGSVLRQRERLILGPASESWFSENPEMRETLDFPFQNVR